MKTYANTVLAKFTDSGVLAAYYELTKPGITFLVLASMAVGFILGSGTAAFNYITFVNALIGTFLIASGTAAHNQFIERDLDKLMLRTRKRPLPMQKIGATNAFIFSSLLLVTGLTYLILTVNIIAGLISALTTLLYLGCYTPMKRVSFLNVFIGAIPGALPPVGGWAAATGSIANPGVWILFGIVFLWQVPHVISIAWLCNDDYSRAGFHMLPKRDISGNKSAITIIVCLILLVPVSILLYSIHIGGPIYLAGSLVAAAGFLYYGLRFMFERSKAMARRLMFASIVYLPVVWAFIFIDKLIR